MNEIMQTPVNEIVQTSVNDIEQKSSVTGFVNTYDLTTYEGKIKTLQATNNAAPLNGHEGEVLEVVDIITMSGIRKGRNGAPDTQCQNTYLVTKPDENGSSTCYFTQSDGIARDVNMIVAMFPDVGKSTVDGHLNLTVRIEQLGNGNTIKRLVPIF